MSDPSRPRRSRKSIAFQPNASGSNKSAAAPAPEAPAKSTRKTRSKSLGPGGLDALNAAEGRKDVLKSGNGNGRRESIAPAVRSILKPTLPVSPPKEIPAHRPRTQLRGAPAVPPTPATSQPSSIFQPPPLQPTQPAASTIPLRTEEEQQRRAEILAQRAARRQSMGNRRVSFAPEATLHTWDVVDYYPGDGSSTPGSSAGGSSRASTPASNRRSSSGSIADVQATPTPPSMETPSTPQQSEDAPATPSTENQKRNRRASVAKTPSPNFTNPDEQIMSSSPLSSTAGDETEFVEDEDEGSHSDSDSTDSIDDDMAPGDRTFVSNAGDTTMGEGDMDFDDDDETVRQPIFKKPMQWTFEGAPEDDDNVLSLPPAAKTEAPVVIVEETEEGDKTMDVTRVIGGLLSTSTSSLEKPKFSFSPKTPEKIDDEDDEGGEMTMEMTRPVGGLLGTRPPIQQSQPNEEEEEDDEDGMDFTRPVGGILGTANRAAAKPQPMAADDEGMTMDMDMTRPIGGILSGISGMASRLGKSIGFGRPQQQPQQQQQQQQQSDDADMTMDMDMTRPIGGILLAVQAGNQDRTRSSSPTSEVDMNEDMTMEFTSVLGGIVNQAPKEKGRRRSSTGTGRRGGLLMGGDQWAKDQAQKHFSYDKQEEEEEDDMDMTMAVGGILSAAAATSKAKDVSSGSLAYPTLDAPATEKSVESVTYPTLPEVKEDVDDNEDFPMEMTVNVGRILQGQPEVAKSSSNLIPKEQPTAEKKEEIISVPPVDRVLKQVDSPTPRNKRATRKSTGAAAVPTITPRVTRGAQRKSLELQLESVTKSSPAQAPTPEEPSPEQQTTLAQTRPARKSKTPQQKPSTPKTASKKKASTPTALQPDLKTEKSLLKTPKAPTELESIPSASSSFSPITPMRFGLQTTITPIRTPLRGVGINKPGMGSPAIAEALSRRKSIGEDALAFSPIATPSALLALSRQDNEKREHEEKEANKRREEAEKKLDLMSKIQLLTPSKRGGRMSLAVGSLGPVKRRFETTDESDRKRRKSMDGIGIVAEEEGQKEPIDFQKPLVKLPGSAKKRTPKKATPKKSVTPPDESTTPSKTRTAHTKPSQPPPQVHAVKFGDDVVMKDEDDEEGEEDPNDNSWIPEDLTLHDFLEMIGVSFLDDLKATAKRRHTGFPTSQRSYGEEATLTARIKAGAGTFPMLNVYQHGCHELDKYIADGNEIMNTIEDIIHDGPAVLRDYLNAPIDVKNIMDIQFRNNKTHARLVAKKEWYTWRQVLLTGVQAILKENLEGLKSDEQTVKALSQEVASHLPELKQAWEQAKYELQKLEEVKRRVEVDDQDELVAARSQLSSMSQDIATARVQAAEKRQESENLAAAIKKKEARKAELVASIEEAERIKEMNRGWSEKEVDTWKSRCDDLEAKHGWRMSKALENGLLEMEYLREIQLVCDPAGNVAPVVKYIRMAAQKATDPEPIAALEADFFINGLNSVLSKKRDLPVILQSVGSYWKVVLGVIDNIRRLRSRHYTEIAISEGGDLQVTATVVVTELRSKMAISFTVAKESLTYQAVDVRVVYGAVAQKVVQKMLSDSVDEWKEGVADVVAQCIEGRRRGGVVVGVKG
ncbi:Spc7 kinetochore protein-domain-containing protein [Tricharina praecox]|uniref:Spc7 kinetochore protein-domain-containing protein n=1 Tax=Tricharina praecox TaxID=43433 RepID=UPI00221FD2AC|nr:Spc7 kinetochore protein-domain-containing protein [Tricharina praecox]KAI5858962.1 Spc7 kinetochore protein-domain-containing protein [Tricharina praecox]